MFWEHPAANAFEHSRSTSCRTWAQVAAWFNPLYHCVQLVRHACFGFEGWVDVAHIAILAAFGLLMWRLASLRMEKRLV